LNVLGGATLLDESGSPLGQQRRRIALLSLVAAGGTLGITRDRLMAVLSPESTVDSARHSLHQLLYYLRQQVGDDLFLGTDPLRLNTAVITSDFSDFETAMEQGAYAEAVRLHRGPFLDGFHLGDSTEFENWAARERARLGARFTEALFKLAREAEARGDHHLAIDWWRRLTVHDPLDGRAALGLIRALAAAGDTPGAVRHAHVHGALVRDELDRHPDPEISAFLASLPLEERPENSPGVFVETGSEGDAGPPAKARRAWISPALIAVALLAIVGATRFWPREEAPDRIGRLAVLPVVNGSADTTVAAITEALTQELIATLSRAGLRVIGYYSVEKYRGSRPLVADIGRELRVDAVATWTVLREDGRWRVSLEVSRARSGEGLWSSTRYAVDSLELGEVAQGAARELVSRFASRFTPRGREPLVTTAGGDPEAKLAYLLGMDRMLRGSEAASYSREQFRRAIAIDSSFATGYAGLGYSLILSIDYGQLSVRDACRQAKPAIDRAFALDPRLTLVHLARARWQQHCAWEWDEADAAYRQAIALEPSAATYHHYGWFLSWYLGRFREGIAFADTALALEPTSPLQHLALAWRLVTAGELDRAVESARAGLALEPRSLDGPWILAEVHLMRGEFDAAEREALALKALPGAVLPNWSMLAEVHARTGRTKEAHDYIAELAAIEPMTGAGQIAIARTQVALGERDAALATLERAVDDGVFIIPYMPYWSPVRDHPRFQALMRRMDLH
jgi:serine/threonine-protein kinase